MVTAILIDSEGSWAATSCIIDEFVDDCRKITFDTIVLSNS